MDTLEEQTRDTGTILTNVCTKLDTSWGVFSVLLPVPFKTITFIFSSVIVSRNEKGVRKAPSTRYMSVTVCEQC